MQRVTSLLPSWDRTKKGSKDVDQSVMDELEGQPVPGDVDVEVVTPLFGIPEPDDPDPFGVHALEEAGFEIREAGTHSRPDSTQFEFRPSPTSPALTHLNRKSFDINYTSNRGSYMTSSKRNSMLSVVQSVSMGTQTDMDDLPSSPLRTPSLRSEIARKESIREEPKETDFTQIDLGPYTNLAYRNKTNGTSARPIAPSAQPTQKDTKDDAGQVSDASNTTEDLDDDEPVVFEAAAASRARGSFVSPCRVNVVKGKAGVVTIPPRPAPPLPPRSSARCSRTMSDQSRPMSHGSTASSDRFRSPLASPTVDDGFQNVDLNKRHESPSRLAHQAAIREGSKEEEGDKDTTKQGSEFKETIDDYVKTVVQAKLAPPSDPETSSQSSKWNAASMPNSKRSSAVLESAPTTTATSPVLENGSDDKQLKETSSKSYSTDDAPFVAEAVAVSTSHRKPDPVKEEAKPIEERKQAEVEKSRPLVPAQVDFQEEAPPGAFPLDVVAPEPIPEDKDLSQGERLFSTTQSDMPAIGAAGDFQFH